MVRYSKKPGKKRAIRRQSSKKGKKSGKSPRRSRLHKPVKKRRTNKLGGAGGKRVTYIYEIFGKEAYCVEIICEDPSLLTGEKIPIPIPSQLKIKENNKEVEVYNVKNNKESVPTLQEILYTYAAAQVIIDRVYLGFKTKKSGDTDDSEFKKYKFLVPYYYNFDKVTGHNGGELLDPDIEKLEKLEKFKALCQEYIFISSSLYDYQSSASGNYRPKPRELSQISTVSKDEPLPSKKKKKKKRGFRFFNRILKTLLGADSSREVSADSSQDVEVIEEESEEEKALTTQATNCFDQIQSNLGEFEEVFNVSKVNELLPEYEQLSLRALPAAPITTENYPEIAPFYKNIMEGIDVLIHDIYQKAFHQQNETQTLKAQLEAEHETFKAQLEAEHEAEPHFLNQYGNVVDEATERLFYERLYPELNGNFNILQTKSQKYSATKGLRQIDFHEVIDENKKNEILQRAQGLIGNAFDPLGEISRNEIVHHDGVRVHIQSGRPPIPRPRPPLPRPRPPLPRHRPNLLVAVPGVSTA